jgi:hypothetical protein
MMILNRKLDKIWREVVVGQFEVLSRILLRAIKEIHKNPLVTLSGPRFKPRISRIPLITVAMLSEA